MTAVPARPEQGTCCWANLMARSPALVEEFYGSLFGWRFRRERGEFGAYLRAELNGRPVAGIGELPRERRLPVAWTTCLLCDDADGTAASVRHCGGTVGVGPLDWPPADARMAIAADPQGAVFGLWQPRTRPEAVAEPGTPVWNELVTRDPSAAGAFYCAVFGYRISGVRRPPGAAGDRLTLSLDGRPVAAVRGAGRALPRDRGAHWTTCFAVVDTGAAVRRAVELGGRVVGGPHEVPGGPATVADPQGAVFSLVAGER